MGNCFSLIFSNRKLKSVENVEEMNEKVESERVEEMSAVAIHAKSTSSIVSFQSELELSVRGSCATVDFEADDESSSSGTLSFQSEDEGDVSQPQEEALSQNKSRLATNTNRTVQHHGLGQLVQSCVLPPVEKPASSSFKNKRSVKDVNKCDGETNCAKRHFGASQRTTKPNKKEQPAEKSKRKSRRFVRKGRVGQEKEMYANKVRIIKKIKDAVKKKASRATDSCSPVLPPDETIARIFDVDVQDCRDSNSSDGASSCSPMSTRPSTANSWDWDSTSDEDIPGPSTGRQFKEVQSVSGVMTRTCSVSSSGSSTTVEDLEKLSIGRETSSANASNGNMGAIPRPSAVTPWYSSTSSEEDLGRPRIRRPHRRVQSTSERARNGPQLRARTPCPTNSWDDSSTLEESEESSSSCLQNDLEPTAEDERNVKNCSRAQSSSFVSSWNSSCNSDEDLEKASLENANSRQKGARSRTRFRLKNNKITPQ